MKAKNVIFFLTSFIKENIFRVQSLESIKGNKDIFHNHSKTLRIGLPIFFTQSFLHFFF